MNKAKVNLSKRIYEISCYDELGTGYSKFFYGNKSDVLQIAFTIYRSLVKTHKQQQISNDELEIYWGATRSLRMNGMILIVLGMLYWSMDLYCQLM